MLIASGPTLGLTSVVIPCFNAVATLPAAIQSAQAQTAPVEILVVDDGSTDGTFDRMVAYCAGAGHSADPRVRFLPIFHSGVAAARNHGLKHAAGEFIQFLDADDWIAPDKIERQIAALDATGAGWCICDTRIIEVDGREELASARYAYAAITDVPARLAQANCIPVHAPLYRRSAIGDGRFPGGRVEDWGFVRAVAAQAPACWMSDVLCEYRKRRGGRNAQK